MNTDAGRNPYRPGVGTDPVYLAGRDADLARMRQVLRSARDIPAWIRMTGWRGIGKTALLHEFAHQAETAGWVTVMLELSQHHRDESTLLQFLTSHLRSQIDELSIGERLHKAAKRAGGIQAVSAFGVGITLRDGPVGDMRETFAATLREALEVCVDKKRAGLVVALDEAQLLEDDVESGNLPLSTLFAAAKALHASGLPLAVVVAGLPSLHQRIQKALTHGERMFVGVRPEQLGTEDVRAAFVKPLAGSGVEVDGQVLERIIGEVQGYPFFVQYWGAQLWHGAADAGVRRFDTALFDAVYPIAQRNLDVDFYDGRFEVMSPAEQSLMLAAADCSYPPLAMSELVKTAGRTKSNVGNLLARIADEGVIERRGQGTYGWTVPGFHAYLQRRHSRRSSW